jgi:hypothetical protein
MTPHPPMRHTILVPEETRARAADYLESLRSGQTVAGNHLQESLRGMGLETLTAAAFLDALINTKVPQIFAESAVAGDGSDWHPTELGILGDISIAVPVTVFDNGNHNAPAPHAQPFSGTLVFTPGALLRNGKGHPPADSAEVTQPNGQLCPEGYFRLYERRLLPVFQHVNDMAKAEGRHAFITIPGLGCGQFAGPFHGQLGAALLSVLEKFLTRHGTTFPNVKAVYYDPFSECSNARHEIHGISLMVRPLLQGNLAKSQLCPPQDYAEDGDDFSACLLFSIVAWDHVSWPGNDFFAGCRSTDDGVKAAATNSMAVLTGIEGRYEPDRGSYLPPLPFHTWEEVVKQHGLRCDGAGLSISDSTGRPLHAVYQARQCQAHY